jgi:hypothetical protein
VNYPHQANGMVWENVNRIDNGSFIDAREFDGKLPNSSRLEGKD